MVVTYRITNHQKNPAWFLNSNANFFISFSVVNELILKEKSDIHHRGGSSNNSTHDLVMENQSNGSAMSSSSSVLAESSAGKSSSARSSMQSSNSSSNNVNKLEDSSNDSGHNSMNTSKQSHPKILIKVDKLNFVQNFSCKERKIMMMMELLHRWISGTS